MRLYMQGEHPKHKGVSDPQQLGTVERYFVEIMDIPRLQQRIDCFIFTRQFAPNINRVSLYKWWCTYSKNCACKLATDRTALHMLLDLGKQASGCMCGVHVTGQCGVHMTE